MLAIALAVASLLAAAPAQAQSPGCQFVNSPFWDGHYIAVEGSVTTFYAGEQLTLTASQPSLVPPTGIRLLLNGVEVDTDPFPGTLQYTIPSTDGYTIRWETVGGGSATWTASCTTAPTAVTFRSLFAGRTPNGVAIRWRTASELGILGFHVYRDVNGRRARLTKRLIAPKRSSGGSYSFLDRNAPRAPSVRYWVQEVGLDGSRTWYGPIRVVR